MKKEISYLGLQKKYGGKFVARRDSRILAGGKTMKELFAEMVRKKIPYDEDVVIGRIPPKGAVCVY